MGGKALKNVKTRRYTKEEYDTAYREISSILENLCVSFTLNLEYRTKDSFGDMDIFIKNRYIPKDFIKYFYESKTGYHEVVYNGPVTSFNYGDLQVDFIFVEPIDWDTTINMYAWNDLGNFIGRVAYSMGLKYSNKGLVYKYKGKYIKQDLIISKDMSLILPFLGFDYYKWLRGFDTQEDIFDYVISSKYFDLGIFEYKNLTSKHRHRNKNRTMYLEFMEYCKDKGIKAGANSLSPVLVDHFKLREHFPSLHSSISYLDKKEKLKKVIANKFNGTKIKNKYGLEGEELGSCIKRFKDSTKDFDNYVLTNDIETIYRDFEATNQDYNDAILISKANRLMKGISEIQEMLRRKGKVIKMDILEASILDDGSIGLGGFIEEDEDE